MTNKARFMVAYKALELDPTAEHMIQWQTDQQMTDQ
jgi:hypothetical protein